MKPSTFGLKRIFLINSLFAGKSVRLDVDGHTALNGANGGGKTSVSRLLPMFYGEETARLQSTAGRKKRYSEFALPHSNSLIIFEYEGASGVCCAVVYRHEAKNSLAYRFLSGPFRETAFSIEDGGEHRFVHKGELVGRWNELRLAHSGIQLDTIQHYRAVIQNDSTLKSTKDARLRNLAKTYSLGDGRMTMDHIQSITSTILSRSGSMEKLKDMVCAVVGQTTHISPPPIHPEHESVVADALAFMDFARKIDAGKARRLKHEYDLLDHQCLIYSRTLAALCAEAESAIRQNTEEHEKLNDEEKQQEARFSDSHSAAIKKRNEHRGAAEALESQITDLDETRDDYLNKEVERKARDLDNIEDIRQERSRAEQRLTDLRNTTEAIETRFARKKEEESKNHINKIERLTKAVREASQAISAENNRHTEDRQRLDRERSQAVERLRDERRSHDERLFQEKTEAQAKATSAHETEEELLQISRAEAHVIEADEKLSEAKRHANSADAEVRAAKKLVDEAIAQKKAADEFAAKREKEMVELQRVLHPEDGSLLKALREQSPGWVNNIGKVIDPELLKRNDLSPQFLQDSDLFYGWDLRLDSLPVPVYAETEEDLVSALKVKIQALEDAKNLLSDREQAVDEAGHKHRKASNNLAHAEAARSTAEAKQELATQSRAALLDEVRTAKLDRQKRAQKTAAQLEARWRQFRYSTEHAVEELENSYEEQIAELVGMHAQRRTELEQNEREAERRLNAEKDRHTEAIEAIESDKQQALSDEGVDIDYLAKIEKDVRRLTEREAEIESYRELVASYRSWLKTHWPKRASLSSEYQSEERKKNAAQIEVNKLESDHDAAIRNLRRQLAEIFRKSRLLKEQSTAAHDLITRLGTVPEEGEKSELDLATLLNEVPSQITRKEELSLQLGDEVEKIDQIIISHESEGLRTRWMDCKREVSAQTGITESDRRFFIHAAEAIGPFMDRDLPQFKKALLQQIRATGTGLHDFYIQLVDLEKSIETQTKRINDAIGEHLKIPSLSDLKLHARSRISDESYTRSLSNFTDLWKEWYETYTDELPGERFLTLLRQLQSELKNCRLGDDISDMFDLTISLKENGSPATIQRDSDFGSVSSNGLSYLALCAIYIGITRKLCPDARVAIHWPIDELTIVDANNTRILFDMLDSANITMVGGFPNSDPDTLRHFKYRYNINLKSGLRTVEVPKDELASLIAKRRTNPKQESADVE